MAELLTLFLMPLVVAAGMVYLLPTLVAVARGHRRPLLVAAVNLLVGWTFAGWLCVLAWAMLGGRRRRGLQGGRRR